VTPEQARAFLNLVLLDADADGDVAVEADDVEPVPVDAVTTAVVAAGALKPTSGYSVTHIENTLSVIAHLSEGIPRHWLDNASLERSSTTNCITASPSLSKRRFAQI
jgi:hypothetical protein